MDDKKLSIDPAGIVLNTDGSVSFRSSSLERKIGEIYNTAFSEKPPGVNTGGCNNASSCSGDNGGNCINGGVCTGFNGGECI